MFHLARIGPTTGLLIVLFLGGCLLDPNVVATRVGTTQTPACPLSPTWPQQPQGITLANGEPFIGGDPFVLFDDGLYKMWHTAFVGGVLGTAYATSRDGLVWEPLLDGRSRRLVLKPTPGAWDRKGIETVSVVKKEGRYFLWYLGYPGDIPDGQGRNDFIGLATSDDGIRWNKVPDPVLSPEFDWEQPFQRTVEEEGKVITFWAGGLQEPSVIWDEAQGLFKMWYAAKFYDEFSAFGRSFVGFRIGYATSSDGVGWTKHPEPVFVPTRTPGTFDPVTVSHTDVIKDPQFGYHLFYAGGGAVDSIGHAFSPNGIDWQRDPANPVLRGQTASDEEQTILTRGGTFNQAVGGPSALLKDGDIDLYYMRSEPGQRNFSGENTVELLSAPCDALGDSVPPSNSAASVVADFSQRVNQPSMSGFLSGIGPTYPSDDLIRPLKPFLIRGDAATAAIVDGLDAPAGRYPLFEELGAWYVLMVSNLWGYPPTNFRDNGPPGDNLVAFEALVTGLAQKVKASGLERVIFDVWNEPDAENFSPGNEDDLFRVFQVAEQAIRAVLPDALISGPSFATYNFERIRRFLDFCLQADCRVNVLSWHELLGQGSLDDPGYDISEVADHLREARQAFLDDPRYAPLELQQIQINEYLGRPDQYRPGEIVAYLSALEAGGADAAAKTCWQREDGSSVNCFNGSLDGLFSPESSDTLAPWWVYRAYANAVAGRVKSVSNSPNLALLAGQTAPNEVQLLIGHPRRAGVQHTSPEPVVVALKHLDTALALDPNAPVRVVVERIPNAVETPVRAPLEVVFERDVTLDAAGGLVVDLGRLAEHEALIVHIVLAERP